MTALVAMLLLVASACGGDDDEPDASGAVTEEQPGQEESPEQDEPSEQDESPEQEEPTQGGTLRFGIVGGGSESLDPHTWVASHDIVRASLVYETLTELDENGNPVMLLASDMQPNADASVWTVTLRSGVEFHDGSTLDAADVLYTIGRIQTQGYGAAVLGGIDLASSAVIDDTTVELHMATPNAEVPWLFADLFTSIVPDGADDFSVSAGTGPFVMTEYASGERSLLEANPSYWGDGPALDAVEVLVISDPAARVNALISGQIDVAAQIPASSAAQIDGRDDTRIAISEGLAAAQFYMRTDTPPFDDPLVRQALRLAIDREKCVEVGLSGYGSVGNDLFGPSHPSYAADIEQRSYDPEAAAALLAQAGYPDGLSVELMTAKAGPGMQECAVVFAESAKAAGIDIAVREVPPDEIYNLEANYLIVPFGPTQWSGSSFQEVTRSTLLSSSFYNETAFADAEFEAEFRAAEAIVDDEERQEAFRALQRQQWEDGGYIVWGIQQGLTGVSSRVGPFPDFPANSFRLRGWTTLTIEG